MESTELIYRRAFGMALRNLREQNGLSQEALAAEGFSRGHISEMERGGRDPRFSMLRRLSGLLGVSLSTLVSEIERNYELLGGDLNVVRVVDIAQKKDGVLWVVVKGTAEFNACLAVYRKIFSVVQEKGASRLLMNCLAVAGYVAMHHRELIMKEVVNYYIEQKLDFSLATVGRPPTVIDHGASLAREHGLNFEVFQTVEAALQWLQKRNQRKGASRLTLEKQRGEAR
jgi:transcriptional regulator with XRE-family HTH domain